MPNVLNQADSSDVIDHEQPRSKRIAQARTDLDNKFIIEGITYEERVIHAKFFHSFLATLDFQSGATHLRERLTAGNPPSDFI